jgi:predicted SAM-dependent methyltransferase
MIRRRLKRLLFRLRLGMARSGSLRLVVGASGQAQPGWIASDISSLNLLAEQDWRTCLRPASLDAILAEHVWEHLSPAAGRAAAARCWHYLRPGGYLRLAVPDGLHPDPAYRAAVRPGGHGAGAADHQVLYTYRSLSALLVEVGFQVHLLEYFDESGQFHFQPWAPATGMIRRSSRFDWRNQSHPLSYTSLIVDAIRPSTQAASAEPSRVTHD